ncbi:Protein Unc-13-like B [Manis pentadactyla]|nr:Protein Unc-13-like B [Manis pentadactyla]
MSMVRFHACCEGEGTIALKGYHDDWMMSMVMAMGKVVLQNQCDVWVLSVVIVRGKGTIALKVYRDDWMMSMVTMRGVGPGAWSRDSVSKDYRDDRSPVRVRIQFRSEGEGEIPLQA